MTRLTLTLANRLPLVAANGRAGAAHEPSSLISSGVSQTLQTMYSKAARIRPWRLWPRRS
jgi:hypothetical protein